jgi:hypothetical protein
MPVQGMFLLKAALSTLAVWKILSFFMKEIDYETEVRLA